MTRKHSGHKYTFAHDKENKVVCMFKQKLWLELLTQFVSYCEGMNIYYKGNE